MKYTAFIALFCCLLLKTNSSAQQTIATTKCGTPSIQSFVNQNDIVKQQVNDIERAIQKWTQQNQHKLKQLDEIITIPVVFHVVYDNPTNNISDEQLLSQIEALNKDFRRLNEDASNTPDEFLDVAADVEIEFCLATRDPNGFPTNGITRTPTSVSIFHSTSYNGESVNEIKFSDQGGVDAWPTNQYLNIWVAPLIRGSDANGDDTTVLGYAQFPGGEAATDGVVLVHYVCGTMGTVVANYSLGRTAAHEVGHWLSLRHIWGDGDCNFDDGVEDTPLSDAPNFNCPANHNSCLDEPIDYKDMVSNYMDYTDDNCQNIFTLGQKARMQSLFNSGNFRFDLTQSLGCAAIDVAANDGGLNILYPTGPNTCPTLEPLIELINFGSDELNFIQITYSIDDGTPQNYEWTGSIAPFSSTEVYLPSIAVSTEGFIHTLTVSLSLPNGFDDGNIDNNSASKTLINLPYGNILPQTFDFEDSANLPNGFEVINPDELTGFETTANGTIYIPNFTYNASGEIDEFILPAIDLFDVINPLITFDAAYAYQTTDDISDVLEVLISVDCGATYTSIYGASGATLVSANNEVVTENFIPNNNEWNTHTLALNNYVGNRKVYLKFRQTRFDGNNLYIDNIQLNAESIGITIVPTNHKTFDLQAYPNPNNGQFSLQFNASNTKTMQVGLFNQLGQKVWQQSLVNPNKGVNTIDLSLKKWHLPNGVYYVHLSNKNNNQVVKNVLLR